MKKILVFVVLNLILYAYEVEIFTPKQFFFEKDIIKHEVLTTPVGAKYKLEKSGSNSYSFASETMGFYEIQFINEFGEVIKESIEVKGKIYTEEFIKTFFKGKDFYEGVKELYIYAENPIDTTNYIYKYLLEKAKEKDSIDEVLNGFKTTKLFFKNFEFEQKEFLEKVYEIKKNTEDIRGEVLTLSLLKNYDASYGIIHGKRALETGINEAEATNDLVKIVDKNMNPEASRILGLYYINKDNAKAKTYLYIGDKTEFFKLLLKDDEEEEYNFYYDKLDEKGKSTIDEVKDSYDKEKMIELFLQKGKLNMDEQRFDIAKDYYNKVISSTLLEDRIKNALFNLGKINIMDRRL